MSILLSDTHFNDVSNIQALWFMTDLIGKHATNTTWERDKEPYKRGKEQKGDIVCVKI